MVFTPFLPTLYHSNPLHSIRIDLLCGKENTKQEEKTFLLMRVQPSSPRTPLGRHASLDYRGKNSLLNHQLSEVRRIIESIVFH